MPISDLTGYIWFGNDSLSYPGYTSSVSFNLNYKFIGKFGDHYTASTFKFQYHESGEESRLYYGSDFPAYEWYNAAGSYLNKWEDRCYKIIEITGGTDATNQTLIAWLEANGTLIALTPQPTVNHYLTFTSHNSFTLEIVDHLKYWDGTLEYSTNTTTWNTWDGTTQLSSASDGTKHNLYLRGTGNTCITGTQAAQSPSRAFWVLTGTKISCVGNIENLLDYQTVANGQHPVMAISCYMFMFYGCTSLISAPNLPATTLAFGCYMGMFANCSSLATAPALPATTLVDGCYFAMFLQTGIRTIPELPATTLAGQCYQYMFYWCTGIELSETQTGDYQTPYRIPTEGTGTDATDALTNMFQETRGLFEGTPTINTTYYTSNTVIPAEPSTPSTTNNIFFGASSINKVYFGTSEVSKIYYGNTLIYEVGEEPTPSGETWLINEELTFEREIYEWTINFTSNNESFTSLYYNFGALFGNGSMGTQFYDGSDWTNQAYRTITFAEPPTGDLLTWLQANAVKQ